MCETLMRNNVAAPEALTAAMCVNSEDLLAIQFSTVGGYMKDLNKLSKLGGGRLCEDGHLPETILY